MTRPILTAALLVLSGPAEAQQAGCWANNAQNYYVVCPPFPGSAASAPVPRCEPGYWLLAIPSTSALVCAKDVKDPLK